MKKIKIILLLVGLIYANVCFAQSGWFWQNPLPQGNDLYSVKFVDSNTAFATGGCGTVLKTTNSGSNWSILRTDSSYINTSLFFINISTGWVIGSKDITHTIYYLGSKVLETTDSGNNWEEKFYLPGSYMYSIEFTCLDTGYITVRNSNNGFIYKTTNRGNSWVQISIIGNFVYKSFFQNNTTGFICGNIGIAKTTDGGYSWQNLYQFPGMGGYFNSIVFLNNNTGIAVGVRQQYPTSYQFVIRTTNNGNNWTEVSTANNKLLMDIKVSSDNSIFVCGNNTLQKTTNFGVNWINLPLNDYIMLRSIDFNSSHGLIGGDLGIILKSSNNGINWINNYFSYRDYSTVTRIRFYNKDIGYATSGTNVYKTTNAGVNWLQFNTQSPTQLLALFVVDSNIVYAGGGNTSVNCPVVKTTNGGLNWVLQNPNAGNGYLYDLFFLNKDTGYCSSGRYVCKTTNGGLNWLQTTFNNENFNSISFVNNYTGFVIGYSNSFKTTNGGINWFQIPVNGQEGYFLNVDTGFVCGMRMKVQKTTNGGLNWFTQAQSNDSWRFYGIRFFNSNLGYAVGDFGAIAKSTNGGNTWTYQNSPTNNRFASVFITDTNAVYISGNGSTILKSTNGGNPIGIISISQNVTDNCLLKQNYPNPFNPQTKIKFELPSNLKGQTSNVKLIIYDLLGREVATLVNEELRPGTYEADWDGSNYSSGVYFYKIISNEYTETKKMVLKK